jgi:hypothetical protein
MGFFHPVALQYVPSIKEECTVSIIRATIIRETKFLSYLGRCVLMSKVYKCLFICLFIVID